eukprot:gene922-1788_t
MEAAALEKTSQLNKTTHSSSSAAKEWLQRSPSVDKCSIDISTHSTQSQDAEASTLSNTVDTFEQDERVRILREEVAFLQDKATEVINNLQQEMAEMRSAAEGTERDLRAKHDEIRRSKEQEIESLNRTIADYKQKMTKDLSAAQQIAEAAQRKCDDMEKRLDAKSAEYSRLEEELSDALGLISLNAQMFRRSEMSSRAKDENIESLKKELEEYKESVAIEINSARQAEAISIRELHETIKRLQEMQEINKKLDDELNLNRPLIALNDQLYRDLGREQAARKKLHNEIEDLKGKIRVYVRIRPMSKTELGRRCEETVLKDGKTSVMIKGNSYGENSSKPFDFDEIFGGAEGNTQVDVFRDTKHLVMSVIDGYNVCIFAYGQTGSGKTYTMIGSTDIGKVKNINISLYSRLISDRMFGLPGSSLLPNGSCAPSAGILPRAVVELYRLLEERTAQVTFNVEVQMFQLYKDKLEDLLFEMGRKKSRGPESEQYPNLRIVLAEHSPSGLVEVDGAESMSAQTPADVIRIIAQGSSRRTTASTNMNSESSRSHLICVLVVKLRHRKTNTVTVGKLTLVDLAGSERVDKSGAQGEVLKEAQSINKSLSALGGVIAAVGNGNSHIPYRDHALTMLMSDSIGGNSKTLMFVNCSPADYNSSESCSSLAFAARCKDITNTVAGPQNGDQQNQILGLKRELAKLRRQASTSGKETSTPLRPAFLLQDGIRDDDSF